MLSRVLKGLAIAAAAAVILALSMTWVVVSVVVPEDGLRLWIPAPVVLAQGVAAIANPPELHEAIPLEPEHARLAATALRELEEVQDAELVRVESAEETVVVRVADGRVHVEVDTLREMVRVHAPIREVREFLESFDGGDVVPADAFRLARSLPSGPLVEVDAPDAEVSVRVW